MIMFSWLENVKSASYINTGLYFIEIGNINVKDEHSDRKS